MAIPEDAVKWRNKLIDRSAWFTGPLEHEEDEYRWIDGATGYLCIISRASSFGHFCGYVALRPGHPLHGVESSEYDRVPSGCRTEVAWRWSQDPSAWLFGFDQHHLGQTGPAETSEYRDHYSRYFGAEETAADVVELATALKLADVPLPEEPAEVVGEVSGE